MSLPHYLVIRIIVAAQPKTSFNLETVKREIGEKMKEHEGQQ
jgi:hypothetical protein